MSLRLSIALLGLVSLPLLAFAACSSESANEPASSDGTDETADTGGKSTTKKKDGGAASDASTAEDSGFDAGLTVFDESEPNNGNGLDSGALQVNAFAVPGVMQGAITPAKDVDAFGLDLTVGDLWAYEVSGAATLAPYFGLTDNYPDSNPDGTPKMVLKGAAGATIHQEHFVLATRQYYAIVADTRNQGASTSTYSLKATKLSRTPTPLTPATTIKAALTSEGTVDLYSFSTTGSKGWDINIRAQRKSPASDMDSELSIYDAVGKKWLLTNGDIKYGIETDSVAGSTIATGSYIAVVRNVAPSPSDLSYEIELTLR